MNPRPRPRPYGRTQKAPFGSRLFFSPSLFEEMFLSVTTQRPAARLIN